MSKSGAATAPGVALALSIDHPLVVASMQSAATAPCVALAPASMPSKVWFVGAGPGDPDLITVKGRDLIAKADAILFAGSLVQQAATQWAPAHCIVKDSKDMTLEQITGWLIEQAQPDKIVIRLQTGDPSLYGALIEMVQPLDAAGVEVEVVPGVSSAMATMACAVESLTLPEVTQTAGQSRLNSTDHP